MYVASSPQETRDELLEGTKTRVNAFIEEGHGLIAVLREEQAKSARSHSDMIMKMEAKQKKVEEVAQVVSIFGGLLGASLGIVPGALQTRSYSTQARGYVLAGGIVVIAVGSISICLAIINVWKYFDGRKKSGHK